MGLHVDESSKRNDKSYQLKSLTVLRSLLCQIEDEVDDLLANPLEGGAHAVDVSRCQALVAFVREPVP